MIMADCLPVEKRLKANSYLSKGYMVCYNLKAMNNVIAIPQSEVVKMQAEYKRIAKQEQKELDKKRELDIQAMHFEHEVAIEALVKAERIERDMILDPFFQGIIANIESARMVLNALTA